MSIPLARIVTSFALLPTVFTLIAQPTFIPDPQFRAALNAWAPGLVDANGFMADANHDLHPGQWDLSVDWSPADLTGIEAIDGNILLTLRFQQGAVLTLDSIGPLGSLDLVDFPSATLPSFGSLGRLAITRAPLLTDLGELGIPDLVELVLNDLTALQQTPALAEGLVGLTLHGYPTTVAMPELPSSLVSFVCEASDNPTLPTVLPEGLETLAVDSMPLLTALPVLPSNLTFLYLSASGVQELDAPLGIPFIVDLDDMPDLVSVTVASGPIDLFVDQAPAITSIQLQGLVQFIDIEGAPLLTDLTVGTDLIGLELGNVQALTNLPELPPTLQNLTIGLSQVPVLPALPEGLLGLAYSSGPLQALPPLPESLTGLYIGAASLSTLPALPEGLLNLGVQQCSIVCLPPLPEGLQSLVVTETGINCMPNHPPAVGAVLPLCTILNSSCPEYAPYISGHVFRDDDGNGQQDPGEPDLANAVVTASPVGYMTGTDSLGNYTMALPIGSYEITAQSDLPYVLGTMPVSYPVELPSPNTVVDGLDFAVQMDTIPVDTRVRNESYSLVRPGFESGFGMNAFNFGPTTVYDVVLELEYDALLIPLGGSGDPEITPTAVRWPIDSIPSGGNYFAQAQFQAPASAVLGDTVHMTARVLPIVLQDVEPFNNTYLLETIVVGSYDPNDKQVMPDVLTIDQGSIGQRVEYLIRFQNTGTLFAERVLITDTLSADLDPTTFSFLGASHACEWFYREGALHFLFDPIFLPDSTSDEPGSHGSVRFSIETRAGLAPGHVVPNEANIYFDFNEPVITEICSLAVQLPNVVDQLTDEGVVVFPVPSQGVVHVQHDGQWSGATITVVDAHGALVLMDRLEAGSTVLQLDALSRGLYVVRVQLDGRAWSQRIVRD